MEDEKQKRRIKINRGEQHTMKNGTGERKNNKKKIFFLAIFLSAFTNGVIFCIVSMHFHIENGQSL